MAHLRDGDVARERGAPGVARLSPDDDEETIMTNGTVKFYNEVKGYGFIAPDGGGKDVFVHATALERSGVGALAEGQKVVFETELDQRSGKLAVSKIQAV